MTQPLFTKTASRNLTIIFVLLTVLTALVYVKTHKRSHHSEAPVISVADMGVEESLEDMKSDIVACPWKRSDWTLAMCMEYRTSSTVTFNGQKITNCGTIPRDNDKLATFDSCVDPTGQRVIRLLNTEGRQISVTVVKAAQEPLCRAVVLARSKAWSCASRVLTATLPARSKYSALRSFQIGVLQAPKSLRLPDFPTTVSVLRSMPSSSIRTESS
jgi:hypothetical protein